MSRSKITSQNCPATGYKRHSVHAKDHLLRHVVTRRSGGILQIYEFCFPPAERCPQVDRLPNFDSLLRLPLLKLHSDALLQFLNPTKGIDAENRNGAAVGLAKPLDALHCCDFPVLLGKFTEDDKRVMCLTPLHTLLRHV